VNPGAEANWRTSAEHGTPIGGKSVEFSGRCSTIVLMAEIDLGHGRVALLDDADLPLVNKWKWHAQVGKHTAYARRNTNRDGKSVSIFLHRVITAAPAHLCVDHIDGDGLNNRRSNLRLVDRAENLWNRRSTAAGVCARGAKWRALLDHRGTRYELGAYDTREAAELARRFCLARLRGEHFDGDFDVLALPPIIRRAVMGAG